MKNLLLVLMIILCGVAAQAATPDAEAHKDNLMRLPTFERACVLIRHYETLHKPQHWPTIGYGHLVKPGENYRKRQYSMAEANEILRSDLANLCAHYRAYGADSTLLACLAYNVGAGRVDRSNLLKKLKAGHRDIHTDYTSFCRYQGRRLESLFRRRWLELELFFKP